MWKSIAFIGVAGLLAACQLEETADSLAYGSAEMESQAEACRAQGGQPVVGLAPVVSCSFPTQDAGKSCSASTECDSLCLANTSGTGGTCADQSIIFGCFETYENGAKATLCID